jgi:phospholipid/cholesterol/gamma-HCH transport system substrate-binding protein
VHEITGVFVLAVVALIVALLFLGGRAQQWFSKKHRFKVALPEQGASGLSAGSRVSILGLTAGAVTKIEVDEIGHIVAEVKVWDDLERFVRTDSLAFIKKTFGVGGDAYLDITRGTGGTLPTGAAIRAIPPPDLIAHVESTLQALREESLPALQTARAMLTEWRQLAADLRETQADLQQVIARLDDVVRAVDRGKGTVGELLVEDDIARQIEGLLVNSGHALDKAHDILKDLQSMTANLPAAADAIAQESRDLPGLVLQIQQTVAEVETFVAGLKRHWLVRRYMTQPSAAPRLSPAQIEGDNP